MGIEKSQGDWIAFLDSDDYWYPEKLHILEKYLNSDYDFICHDMHIKENDKIRNKIIFKKDFNFKKNKLLENLIIEGNKIFNSSVIVKKEILAKVNNITVDHPSHAIDYHTWLKISQLTDKFFHINKKLGVYRRHNTNLSLEKKPSKIYFEILIKFKKYISKKNLRKALGYYSYLLFIEKVKIKNYRLMYKYFKFSLNNGTNLIKLKTLKNLMNMLI